MKNNNLTFFAFILLLIWYTLVFFDIPRLTTDGRANLFSLLGLLELLLLIILLINLLKWKYADYVSLPILFLWGFLQYEGNWKNFFNTPTTEVLNSYYKHFHGTLRIFAESENRIVPDAYHIILGLLILLNITLILTRRLRRLKNNS